MFTAAHQAQVSSPDLHHEVPLATKEVQKLKHQSATTLLHSTTSLEPRDNAATADLPRASARMRAAAAGVHGWTDPDCVFFCLRIADFPPNTMLA